MKIESFDKEKSVVITTMGQKLVRELQSTTQKETLEEAAYQARRDYQDEVGKDGMNECIMFDAMKIQKGFELGAKWQAERMYSEEDMIEFAKWVFLEVGSSTGKDRTNKELFDEWFEQFKKKIV